MTTQKAKPTAAELQEAIDRIYRGNPRVSDYHGLHNALGSGRLAAMLRALRAAKKMDDWMARHFQYLADLDTQWAAGIFELRSAMKELGELPDA